MRQAGFDAGLPSEGRTAAVGPDYGPGFSGGHFVNEPQGSDSKSLVLAATDIVELIGQTVSLKRRGKDFVGLCPFHQEKTASFSVSPTRQMFYCYGCKEGGNAIDFVIQRDRIEFIEALRVLADRAGIELARFGGNKEDKGLRQLLLDAQSAAGS